MRRLIQSTSVTLDGVISSPAEWSGPYLDEQYRQYACDLLFGVGALLLGRETYEELADATKDLGGVDGEYRARINSLPKYVASRHPLGDATGMPSPSTATSPPRSPS